jgi:hypothetical protein
MHVRSLITLTLAALLLALAPARAGAQVTFLVFKATLELAVRFQTVDGGGNPIVAVRKLKTNDVINLALGRSLATKPNKATEVLALAADDSTPGPLSRLVVYNPATNTFTTTVWTLSGVALFSNTDFSDNVGIGNATFAATTLGDPAKNGFSSTTLAGAGTGKGTGGSAKAASTALSGRVKFTTTDANNVTTTIDGLVVSAKFKAGGKTLGVVF